MFVAFLESIKYTGHLYPVSFLRVYMGYFYLQQALEKYTGVYLSQARFASQVREAMNFEHSPDWYLHFMEEFAVPYWKIFAYSITSLEFLIGLSFILGYLVRPFAILASLLSLALLWLSPIDLSLMYKTFIAIHITLAWLGAGRCLGIDYYFYKKMRGIWW